MNKVGERYDKMVGYHYSYYDIGNMTLPDFFRLVKASPLRVDIAIISGFYQYNNTCSLDSVIEDFAAMKRDYFGEERWNISIFFKTANGERGNLFCFPAENNLVGVQAETPMPPLDELLDLPNTLARLQG